MEFYEYTSLRPLWARKHHDINMHRRIKERSADSFAKAPPCSRTLAGQQHPPFPLSRIYRLYLTAENSFSSE